MSLSQIKGGVIILCLQLYSHLLQAQFFSFEPIAENRNFSVSYFDTIGNKVANSIISDFYYLGDTLAFCQKDTLFFTMSRWLFTKGMRYSFTKYCIKDTLITPIEELSFYEQDPKIYLHSHISQGNNTINVVFNGAGKYLPIVNLSPEDCRYKDIEALYLEGRKKTFPYLKDIKVHKIR